MRLGVHLLSAAMVLAWTGNAGAQTPRPAAGARPIFGVSYGAESLPTAIDPACGPPVGRRTGSVVGAYLVVPLGAIGVQGGASLHPRGAVACASVGILHDGIVTTRSVDVSGGDFMTADIRLRLPGGAGSWWQSSFGGGWAGSGKGLPYMTLSIGARARGSIVAGIDAELTSYRVPSILRTADYRSETQPVVLSEHSSVDWEHSIALRLVLEVPASHSP